MYPCGNCRAVAVGPDGRCAACGTYQQQLQQTPPAYPAPGPGYPAGGMAPVPGMPPGGVDLRRGLSTTVQVLCGVMAGVLLLAMIARGQQYGQLSDVLDGHFVTKSDVDDADDFYAGMLVLQGLTMVALAIVWAIWFRRLRLNAEAFAPGTHRFSPGWAAGAWFTPVVNFWFPKQIGNDIWRASSPQGPQYARRGLLNGWWVTWITGSVISWIAMMMYTEAKDDAESMFASRSDAEDAQTALGLHLFSYVVLIAAAIVALLMARQITAMQEQRAAMGPQAAPPAYGGGPAYGVPGQAPYGGPGMPPVPPGQPGQSGQPYPPYGQG